MILSGIKIHFLHYTHSAYLLQFVLYVSSRDSVPTVISSSTAFCVFPARFSAAGSGEYLLFHTLLLSHSENRNQQKHQGTHSHAEEGNVHTMYHGPFSIG